MKQKWLQKAFKIKKIKYNKCRKQVTLTCLKPMNILLKLIPETENPYQNINTITGQLQITLGVIQIGKIHILI